MNAVTRRESQLLVHPIAAWGFALLFLHVAGRTDLALLACYPLAVWNGLVSLWWGRRAAGRVRDGHIDRREADHGVKWIGQLLAITAASPGIIFLAANPLHEAAWATTASVVLVSAVAYAGVSLLVRLSNRYAHALALTLACIALPLNATGAVSLGFWLGLLDPVVGALPGLDAP